MPDQNIVLPSDVDLDETAGDASVLVGIATGLKRPTTRDTLAAIQQYLKTNLRMVEHASYDHPIRGRRTSVEILRSEAWGCSAHAQVACHLARACGIPAILVKSFDVEWVDRKNRGDGYGDGHVYVEVLKDGKPALWDAEGGRLHENCDPAAVTTPDGRQHIYDKGRPEVLVLSHHGVQWKKRRDGCFPHRADEIESFGRGLALAPQVGMEERRGSDLSSPW